MLYYYSTTSKPGNWCWCNSKSLFMWTLPVLHTLICVCMCIVLCGFITSIPIINQYAINHYQAPSSNSLIATYTLLHVFLPKACQALFSSKCTILLLKNVTLKKIIHDIAFWDWLFSPWTIFEPYGSCFLDQWVVLRAEQSSLVWITSLLYHSATEVHLGSSQFFAY